MNIFIREMKANAKSLFFWSIGLIIVIVVEMSEYKSTSASGQSLNDLIAKMPESLKSLMGGGSLDLSKVSGFYGVLFLYFVLMVTIHAAILGGSIISKEERDKTSEFLFVKPVSRAKIITTKLCAAILNIIILNLATLFSSLIVVNFYNNGEDVTSDILKLMFGMLILQLIFLFMGTAISALSKKPRLPLSITTGILLFMYILSMAIDINSDLEPLKYLTPFKYFEAKNLMYGGEFQFVFVFLSILIIGVCGSVTYSFYEKKNLSI
jgi:ABC-2 type transport system permease protein